MTLVIARVNAYPFRHFAKPMALYASFFELIEMVLTSSQWSFNLMSCKVICIVVFHKAEQKPNTLEKKKCENFLFTLVIKRDD